MLILSRQKNALIGGLLGGVGGGQLLLELIDAYTNITLDARQAAALTGAVSTALLLAARPAKYLWAHGVRGSWNRILDGAGGDTASRSGSGPPPVARTLTDADVAAIADAIRTP